jgi:hypothetical protein
MAGDLPPSSSVTGTRFAGRLHDGSSDGGASGEDEMIERQGGERGTIAVDDRDLLFRKDLADHRREHGVRRGANFDGLSMTRLPAAITVTTGISDRLTGSSTVR